jgi:hypothetical protein
MPQSLDVMANRERLWLADARHLIRARATQQLNDRWLDLRRAIERLRERVPGLGVEHELRAVGKDHLGPLPTALDEELGDGFPHD